jgi:hypothetical protein
MPIVEIERRVTDEGHDTNDALCVVRLYVDLPRHRIWSAELVMTYGAISRSEHARPLDVQAALFLSGRDAEQVFTLASEGFDGAEAVERAAE